MVSLLSLYREKTRKLNKNDLEQFILNNIFRKHCTNVDEVVNQSQEEQENLYGKAKPGDVCSNGEESAHYNTDDSSEEGNAEGRRDFTAGVTPVSPYCTDDLRQPK